MQIKKTRFNGLCIVEYNRLSDGRGWFEKKFNSLDSAGLIQGVTESYISKSVKGALRGLHFQQGEFAQDKLVTCVCGRFIDIALDLRKCEPTYKQLFMHELDGNDPVAIFVPGGFAHGIYSLEHDTVLLSYASGAYNASEERGILWRSIPELSFISDPIVSEKDAGLQRFEEYLEDE